MNFQKLLRVRWLAGMTALLSLTACGDDTEEPPPVTELTCDAATYSAAVRDAVEPSADDITTNLIAITPSNTKLIWNADKTAVRMVVWTTFTGYAAGANLLSRDVFVTSAPQVQELCKTVATDKLVPRINEYLGLPPPTESDNARFFVEMWVKPADMFRPCPDSEIDDTTCGLTFPSTATADHISWMNSYYASSYGFWQKTQYPWTGLGYTYDWCNADTHQGASEFVIRKGSTVDVTAQIQRNTYCAP
jgi:hypothetical protein